MRALYEQLYAGSAYREFSPGETRVRDFQNLVKTTPDDVIIDFGCGTGRAAKTLGAIGLDFVKAVETDIEFHQHDLRKPAPVKGTVGFCTDVLEHIHPRDVKRVLGNIMGAVDRCYFQICTVKDDFGATVGHPLHLTVKPFWWWAKQMPGVIRYGREEKNHAIFVVQRSRTIRELDKRMELMAPPEKMREYILENLKAGYADAVPKEVQDTEVAILAGGPSLDLFLESGWKGPVITVNGAYNWAIEKGFKPTAQIIVDPRQFNRRFVEPHIEGCRYLIGSQCHPDVARAAPKSQVLLWQSGDIVVPVLEEFSKENGDRVSYPVFGGSTVMLRGIPLLLMLGIRKFHIYGWDSCLMDGAHHAYAQPENEETRIMDILIGGRTFKCHAWMAVQAQEFVDLVKHMLPGDCQLEVYGDGLIAHILKTGAIYGGSSLESIFRG